MVIIDGVHTCVRCTVKQSHNQHFFVVCPASNFVDCYRISIIPMKDAISGFIIQSHLKAGADKFIIATVMFCHCLVLKMTKQNISAFRKYINIKQLMFSLQDREFGGVCHQQIFCCTLLHIQPPIYLKVMSNFDRETATAKGVFFFIQRGVTLEAFLKGRVS